MLWILNSDVGTVIATAVIVYLSCLFAAATCRLHERYDDE